MLFISASSLAAFFRCKFQWYALYVLRYREPLNHNLFFGLRFDDTLNYNYGEKITSDKDLPKADLQDYFRAQWDAQKDQVHAWEDKDPTELKEVGTKGLSVFYDEVVKEVHPTQVQPKLRMTFKDSNVILSGRPDVLEASQIIDNKTAKASKPETYIKQAIQPPIYSILTQPDSDAPQEVRFDVLVKTKKPKVQQIKTVITQEKRDATLKVVANTVDAIRMMKEKKNFPPDAFFRQGWECVTPDTMVLTSGGYRRIDGLKPGALVMTRMGYKAVSAVVSQPIGERKTFVLKPYYGERLRLTGNHPVLVAKYKGCGPNSRPIAEPTWITADELYALHSSKGPEERYRLILQCRTEEHPLPSGMTDARLRLLGYFMAEGCFDHKRKNLAGHYGMMFVTGTHEQDFAEDIAKDFTSAFGIGHRVRTKMVPHPQGTASLQTRIKDVKSTQWMAQYISGTARSKRFSDEVMLWPVAAQHVLLDAMIRGDGCETKARNTPVTNYATASRELALQVQEMWMRRGFLSGITIGNSSGFGGGPLYHVVVYHGHRTYGRSVAPGRFEVPIQEFRSIAYEGDVWDITVEDAHEFVTSAGVVHNCGYCAVANLCRKTWGLDIPESKLHKNSAAKPPEPKKPVKAGEKPKADKLEPPDDHRSIMV